MPEPLLLLLNEVEEVVVVLLWPFEAVVEVVVEVLVVCDRRIVRLSAKKNKQENKNSVK